MSKTILITGASSGFGRDTAETLFRAGHTVYASMRGAQGKNREAAEALWKLGIKTVELDVNDDASVEAAVKNVLAEAGAIDVLVNNAGIGTAGPGDGDRLESADGHELRFAVNYLAPFLLTRRLLALIERSAPARIVNVSSAGQAPIDFDDVMLERAYSGIQAYCQSKLALVMFTFDLAEELEGSGVTANCLHPGTYMPTNMVRAAGVEPVTPLEDGVAATMRLITSPELDGVNGHYFDGISESAPHPQAEDPEARRQLRELSEELTGIHSAA
jgi:NAD(P)-dependent dehydrogenase (short-subunit alcohol dehydrogenase family)